MAEELYVVSPEKTVVSFKLASIGSRILAHLLDVFLFLVVTAALATLFSILSITNQTISAMSGTFLSVWVSLGPFLYFIVQEGLWNGQTIGKRAANIRVRMSDGTPITFGAALGRNLIRPADLFPGTYFAGLVCMFTNQKSQRVGDLFANTIVVHEQQPTPYFAPAPHIVGLHQYEQLVGELKGMSIEEYVALKRLCDRFPELTHNVQLKTLRDVWEPIAKKYEVPQPSGIHPLLLAEAVVMRYGRTHGLL